MNVPILDLTAQHEPLLPQFRQVFERLMGSGAFILGQAVEQFEAELAAYCDCSYAVGMSSGTDALLAAMMALGIGPDDEVITSTFSFFATAGSIARLGAKPVFVDVDEATFNLNADQVAAAVSPRTAAIMPVHLFGLAADMQAIRAVAERHHLPIIEDAAQAIGARDHGQCVGAMGDIGCLSFFPTKNLGGMGDAGACVTNDAKLAQTLRQLRNHGSDATYHHTMVGGNFRIDALQAGMLEVKLAHLNDWITARRNNAARYQADLQRDDLVLPGEPAEMFHTYNQYTLRVLHGRRDALMQHITQRGIGCRVYYPLPLHLQPCFAYLDYQAGQLPVAERLAREVLSLPVFPELGERRQNLVVEAVREFAAGE